MDKYIKMLLAKLNQRYKAAVTSVMYCHKEDGRLSTMHTLRISKDGQRKALCKYVTSSKRDLVGEMMKWAHQESQ